MNLSIFNINGDTDNVIKFKIIAVVILSVIITATVVGFIFKIDQYDKETDSIYVMISISSISLEFIFYVIVCRGILYYCFYQPNNNDPNKIKYVDMTKL